MVRNARKCEIFYRQTPYVLGEFERSQQLSILINKKIIEALLQKVSQKTRGAIEPLLQQYKSAIIKLNAREDVDRAAKKAQRIIDSLYQLQEIELAKELKGLLGSVHQIYVL